jgi:hypothetical protein
LLDAGVHDIAGAPPESMPKFGPPPPVLVPLPLALPGAVPPGHAVVGAQTLT